MRRSREREAGERTVLSQAQRIAVHERAHLKQVAAIVDAMRS